MTPVNDAPVANPDTANGPEDTLIAGNVVTNDTDVEGDTLTVTQFVVGGTTVSVGPAGGSISLAEGVLTIQQDGSFTFNPAASFNGSVPQVTYTITDGPSTADATLDIEVGPVNDPPVAVDDTFTTDQDTTIGGDLTPGTPGQDSDVDGDPITVININGATFVSGDTITLPSGALLTINDDGTFAYDPNDAFDTLGAGQSLQDQFTYTITDPDGATAAATVRVTVNGLDDVIEITGLSDGPVAGTDGAVEEPDMPAGTTPADTGEVTTGTFILTAGDSIQSVTINGTVLTTAPTPSSPITLAGANGTLSLTAFDPATGAVSYTYALTTAASHAGPGNVTDDFAIVLTDGNGDTATGTLAILIVDDAPIAAADGNSVTENSGVPATGTVLANDVPGADGFAALPVSGVAAGSGAITSPTGVGAPVTGTYGTLTLNGDGTYSYSLDDANPVVDALQAVDSLNDVFTYETIDADGSTSTATLTIAITGANDPPVAVDDTITTPEDTPVTIPVRGNDGDVDGDPLTVTEINGTPVTIGGPGVPVTGGVVTLDPSGNPVFTPDADFNGTPTFTYTVDDGNGGTDTATVTVDVTPVNDPPVAVDDTVGTKEDKAVVLNLPGNDRDVDGDVLTVTAIDGQSIVAGGAPVAVAGGTVAMTSDGTTIFTPTPGYSGDATFTYTIGDGNGGSDTASVTVSIEDLVVVIEEPARTSDPTDEPTAPTSILDGLDTDPIVIRTVEGFGDLPLGWTSLGTDLIVIQTANDVSYLGSVTGNGADPSIGETIENASRLDELAGNAERAFGITIPSFDVESITGFSLRMDVAGIPALGDAAHDGQIIVETFVADRIVYIQLSNTLDLGDGNKVAGYRVLEANGRPLPAWVKQADGGLLLAEVPAGAETIDLRISALKADGGVIERSVSVTLKSGEVSQLAAPQERPPTFSEQIRATGRR